MTDRIGPHLTPDDLDVWLAGGVAPAMERHIEECPECLALVRSERALAERLAALPLFAPQGDFAERVMAAVRVPDPFAIRSLRTARRRLLATRKSVVIAASLAVIVVGSMAASVVWTLANRDTLLALGSWLGAEAAQWAWVAVRGAALNLMEQPWFSAVRGLLEAPGRLALASAFGTLMYVTGVLALRRLLAVPAPTRRVAHAAL
ncbi:MAG TPA: hypothetical protein VFU46_13365 [Gemmatimonadales bacterium]|nr:hypothetical protein [Gemmatimonadales bacterium]